MEAISSFSLLISLTGFPLVLALARVIITTGSMRQFLNPTEVAQIVQLLQDGTSTHAVARRLCVPAQSPEHEGDSRRQAVTLGELDRAVEGPQPISRTDICCFVQGGTG